MGYSMASENIGYYDAVNGPKASFHQAQLERPVNFATAHMPEFRAGAPSSKL